MEKVHLRKLLVEQVYLLYTGMVFQGPAIGQKISNELINILKIEGFKNISEAIGTKKST